MDAAKAEAKFEMRKKAVEAVRSGEPVAVVARVLGVPHRTVFHWLSKYRQGGLHNLREEARSGRLSNSFSVKVELGDVVGCYG
jgi:transposase-like protein